MRGTRRPGGDAKQRGDEERETRALLSRAEAEAEAELGLPIPRGVWEYIHSTFGGKFTDREEAEGYAAFIPQYVGLIAAWNRCTASRPARKKLAAGKCGPPTPKALARNLELVWFVTERVIPFLALRQGRFQTDFRRGPRAPGRAGPWDQLCDEWNQMHPRIADQKGSGETLRREYRDAVVNEHVTRALLEDLKWRQAKAVLQRLCFMAPGAPPASVGNACILDLPIIKATEPDDLRQALARADGNPLEALRLLGATEDELQRHADDVRTYLREHATLEDRLAYATLSPEVAERPLLAPIEGRPRVALCAVCVMQPRSSAGP